MRGFTRNPAPLCRHIKTDSTRCGSPATKNQPFCYNHRKIRRTLSQVTPAPDPYGWERKTLPLVYAEDRAALQLNYAVIIASVAAGRMSVQIANCLNRLLRSCETNLNHGRLYDCDSEPVEDLVVTPEGEEIAPPEEGDQQLTGSTPSSGEGRAPSATAPSAASNDPAYLENLRAMDPALRREHMTALAAGLEPPAHLLATPPAQVTLPKPVTGVPPQSDLQIDTTAPATACASSTNSTTNPSTPAPRQPPRIPENAIEAQYFGVPWPYPGAAAESGKLTTS